MRLGRAGRRLAALSGALSAAVLAAALLLHWGVLCTNMHVWQHVNRVCIEHMSGEALGNLCEPLCVLEAVQAVSCQPNSGAHASIFTANWGNRPLTFRLPTSATVFGPDLLYWVDEKKNRHYPTEDQFKVMIKELVMSKLNVTITDAKAEELSRLPQGHQSNFVNVVDASKRATEMDNIWTLLQDYEYMLTILFGSEGLFPEKIGTCGSLYAVEQAEAIRGTSALFSLEDTPEEWERRARLAVLIMELLEKFEHAKLHLCDVQLSHFGASGGRLKHMLPTAVFAITKDCKAGDGGRDSLQAVCERVFLGRAAGGRVLLPGLLTSRRAPPALAALLRRCADPLAAPLTRELKRAFYNTLVRRH